MMKAVAFASTSALMLAGCGTMHNPMNTQTVSEVVSDAPTPTGAAAYAARAVASDQYEIQSSRLALQKSSNQSVREFAQMMIDNHMQTSQTLATQMQKAGLAMPPSVLPPEKMQMVAALQAVSGEAFDRLYVRQQTAAHAEALALHQAYSLQGDNLDLRYAASLAVPTIQTHMRRLEDIAQSMG